MRYSKRLAAAVLTLVMLFAVPMAGVVSAAQEGQNDDPGSGRLSGNIPAAFFDSAQDIPALGASIAGTTGTSPFTDKIYVHNSAHENHKIMHGVDVSKYQAEIDWYKAAQAGVEFAILRVGYRGYGSAGTLVADTSFAEHAANAARAGIPIGVYIYSQAITTQEAVEEARFVLDRIGNYSIELPVVLDFEFASVGGAEGGRLYNANLSVEDATAICNAFCRTVAAAGYEPMVYANKNMLSTRLDAADISSNYKIWLAHYTTGSSYTGDYEFWQYTSQGTVDGIPGNVDCNFWYIEVPAEAVDITTAEVDMYLGTTLKLNAYTTPRNATTPIRWSSSDTDVLTVDSTGVLHPVAAGTVTVTAHAGDVYDICSVTVEHPPVSGVKLSDSTLRLGVGTSAVLTAQVQPVYAKDQSVSWSSSNSSIARVSSDGTVTAVKAGTATITAKTTDGGFTASCHVTVGAAVTSLTLSKSMLQLYRDKTATLTARVLPAAAASFWDVEYSSADASVATVSADGTVTAVGIGSTVVTVTAGGKSAACTVTVLPQTVSAQIDVKLPFVTTAGYKDISFTLTPQDSTTVYNGTTIWNSIGASLKVTVREGGYVLRITKPGCLSYTDMSYTIGYGENPTPELLAGDLNSDGFINALDTAIMVESMDSSSVNGIADFNDDGTVDSVDRAKLVSNFGKTDVVID